MTALGELYKHHRYQSLHALISERQMDFHNFEVRTYNANLHVPPVAEYSTLETLCTQQPWGPRPLPLIAGNLILRSKMGYRTESKCREARTTCVAYQKHRLKYLVRLKRSRNKYSWLYIICRVAFAC